MPKRDQIAYFGPYMRVYLIQSYHLIYGPCRNISHKEGGLQEMPEEVISMVQSVWRIRVMSLQTVFANPGGVDPDPGHQESGWS